MVGVDSGVGHDGARFVRGATIGIDEHGTPVGKVLRQPRTDGLHDMPDGLGVVVARDADKNFRRSDSPELRLCFLSERGPICTHRPSDTVSVVGSHAWSSSTAPTRRAKKSGTA